MNSLTFVGTGGSEGIGLDIDNVTLVKVGTTDNLVVNGGFEDPVINNQTNSNEFQLHGYPGIKGWTTD
jgi:hypothetical protein